MVASWVVVAGLGTALRWDEIQTRTFRDPDDGMRLVQVRDLLGGQGWWDLSQQRLGSSGLEMHWSRHMDGLLGSVIVLLRPLVGDDTAELVAMLTVPLALLLTALWLIYSIAERVTSLPGAGLFALLITCFTLLPLQRMTPGALDHHGLQLVLMLVLVRAMVEPESRRWPAVAGAAAGVSLTVALETLPIVALVIAALGAQWASGHPRHRSWYRTCGLSLVFSLLGSALLFSRPGALLSAECDVVSLGFVGLVSLPSLGLAAVGGIDLPTRARWAALAAMGASGLAWFASTTPECAAGPYGDVPELAMRIWIDRIAEVTGLFDRLVEDPGLGLFLGAAPVAALATIAWLTARRRRFDLLPVLSALAAIVALGIWQTRALISGQVLGAPVLGAATSIARERLSGVVTRATATFLLILTLSGFLFLLFSSSSTQSNGDSRGAIATCTSPELLAELDELEPGLVAGEMNLASQLLLHTDHRVLAANLHRGYEGVLAAYEIAGASPAAAAATARKHNVDYVILCPDSSTSSTWRDDHPNGLYARLLDDDPPPGFQKVIDEEAGRVYAVQ